MLKAVHSAAVVSVSVKFSDNVTITAEGLRTNATIARALGKGGMAENVDVGILVPLSAFAAVDYKMLRGKSGSMTKGSNTQAIRILSTEEYAPGEIIMLLCGDYDKAVA